MSFFAELLEYMSETDLIHLFFPWLLTLSITYGVLDKYDIFEDPSVDGMVSLSVSFLAMGGIYFFAPEALFVNFGAALAFASFVALGFMIVMAVAGIELEEMTDTEKSLPLIGGLSILGISLLIIGGAALGLPELLSGIEVPQEAPQEVLSPVLIMVFILAAVYLTSR